MSEIDLRRLVIKAFHMNDVKMGDTCDVKMNGQFTVSKDIIPGLLEKYDEIENIDINLIAPGDHDRYTNTIMDIIPISTKVLGKCGEGITHTITGVYVMLTGVDTEGKQAHEFGSSEGNLKDMLRLNKAGTPGDHDYIISFDVLFKKGQGQERKGCLEAHSACDEFIQVYRDKLKKFDGKITGRELLAHIEFLFQVFLHVLDTVLNLMTVVDMDMTKMRIRVLGALVSLNDSVEKFLNTLSRSENGRNHWHTE